VKKFPENFLLFFGNWKTKKKRIVAANLLISKYIYISCFHEILFRLFNILLLHHFLYNIVISLKFFLKKNEILFLFFVYNTNISTLNNSENLEKAKFSNAIVINWNFFSLLLLRLFSLHLSILFFSFIFPYNYWIIICLLFCSLSLFFLFQTKYNQFTFGLYILLLLAL